MLDGGLVSPRRERPPQGGPLSPLLSNVLLTELDRVMAGMNQFLETRLRLAVNTEKGVVDRPWRRSFLGYSVSWHKSQVRLRVAPKSLKAFMTKLRPLLKRSGGKR